MKDLIKKILEEEWDWDNLEEAIPVSNKDLKRYVIHSTNVDPRELYNNGINPVCASESKTWKNLKYPCVVFAVNAYHTAWVLGETKGAVVIDTSLIPDNKWWYDPSLYNERDRNGKIAIITDTKIPANAVIGILCLNDLKEMVRRFQNNTSDEEVQQYLDDVMRVNNEEWSNDCIDKSDSTSNKEEGKDKKVKTNYINKIMKDKIRQIIREETKELNPKVVEVIFNILNKITKDYKWYYLERNIKNIFGTKTYKTYNLVDINNKKWFMTINKKDGRGEHQFYPYGDMISKYIPIKIDQYNKIVAMWATETTGIQVDNSYEEHLGTADYDFFPDLLNDIINDGKLVVFNK